MRPHPRSIWIISGLILLVLLSLTFSRPASDPAEVSQSTPDPVIDSAPFFLPIIARNYPDFFPPPLEARKVGWLRKWRESQPPNYCLQVSGTPYYLEREPGEAGWLAAVAETNFVRDLELEVHIGQKVAITGTVQYFDPACDFPRLNAQELEVIEVSPDGPTGY